MPSRTEAASRGRQKGFSLLEVMFASTILSIFILGIGGFWYQASSRVSDLVLRQKAIFVLSGELERISALYVYTSFPADLVNGPVTTTGYNDGLASIPTTRLVYPTDVSSFAAGNYVTTAYATFSADQFHVLLNSDILPSLNRTYVWIDKNRNIVGRLSWTTTDISVVTCIQAADCSCQRSDNLPLAGGVCKRLDAYLEYPYRIDSSGNVTAPVAIETLSLKTIVGRG
jgi:prepilin-type N-terminal cleavage/methylation domain-containing protein